MDLQAMISKKVFPPVLLICGEEEYLIDHAAEQLFSAASALDATGMNADMMDGEDVAMDAILSVARSYPMMSERRVLWVRRFEKVTVGREGKKGDHPLLQYVKQPLESTFLLLTATLPPVKNKSTAKFPWNALFQHASVIEYPRMREHHVAAWVRDRVQVLGRTITTDASDYLVARCGTSLRDLSMEIDKLTLYMGDRTDITVDDVNDIAGAGKTYTIFELQKAIGRRDLPAAMTICTKMMEAERLDMLIITMLTRYFVTLFRLSDVRGVMNDNSEIARTVGIPPYFVNEYVDVLQRYSPAHIEAAISALGAADATIKSTSTNSILVLQSMLVRIMS